MILSRLGMLPALFVPVAARAAADRRGSAAADCADDPDGTLAGGGKSCASIVPTGCDTDLSTLSSSVPQGTLVKQLCPLSCGVCTSTSPSGHSIDSSHLRMVDYDPTTGNFLFRSGFIGNSTAAVALDELKGYFKERAQSEGVSFPQDFYLVDLCLLTREWAEEESRQIDAEKAYFAGNPSLGSFEHWPLYGIGGPGYGTLEGAVMIDQVCSGRGVAADGCKSPQPADFAASDLQALVPSFATWGDEKDQLQARVEQVRTWLQTQYSKPRVFLFHCTCGCDRTGQFAGVYSMRYKGWGFRGAAAYNNKLAGRHMVYQHQIAMQWHCHHMNASGVATLPDCNQCDGTATVPAGPDKGATVQVQCHPDLGKCEDTSGVDCSGRAAAGCTAADKVLCPASCDACNNKCDDDPDGTLAKAGRTCAAMLALGCGTDLSTVGAVPAGTLVSMLCPSSCNACPPGATPTPQTPVPPTMQEMWTAAAEATDAAAATPAGDSTLHRTDVSALLRVLVGAKVAGGKYEVVLAEAVPSNGTNMLGHLTVMGRYLDIHVDDIAAAREDLAARLGVPTTRVTHLRFGPAPDVRMLEISFVVQNPPGVAAESSGGGTKPYVVALIVTFGVITGGMLIASAASFAAEQKTRIGQHANASIVGVRNLTVLLSVCLVVVASVLTGFLSITSGSKALDETTDAYEAGLTASFRAAQENVGLVNEWHMNKVCDEVVAQLSGFFRVPAVALDSLKSFVLAFPLNQTNNWDFVNGTLRPVLRSVLVSGLHTGVTLAEVWQPNRQGGRIPDFSVQLQQDGNTASRPRGQYQHIVTQEVWPEGWVPDAWRRADDCPGVIESTEAASGKFGWDLRRRGFECVSDEKHLDILTGMPQVTSVEECAQRCFDEPQCTVFGVGTSYKTGFCTWEKPLSSCCPEGWEPDKYDYYTLRTPENRVSAIARMSWIGTSDDYGYVRDTPCNDTVLLAMLQYKSFDVPLHDPDSVFSIGRCSLQVESIVSGGFTGEAEDAAKSRAVREWALRWGPVEGQGLGLGLIAWTYWPVGDETVMMKVALDVSWIADLLRSLGTPEGSRVYVVQDRVPVNTTMDGAVSVPHAVAVSHGRGYRSKVLLEAHGDVVTAQDPAPIVAATDPVIRAHAEHTLSLVSGYDVYRPEDLHEFTFAGGVRYGSVLYFVKVKPISDEHGLDLKVCLLVRNDVIMYEVDVALARTKASIRARTDEAEDSKDEDQATMIYTVGGCSLVLLAVSVMLAVAITAPLGPLRQEMLAVATMQLEAVDEKRPLSILDEVRSMQTSFLKMVGSLRELRNYMPQSALVRSDDEEEDDDMSSSKCSAMHKSVRSGGSAVSRQSAVPVTPGKNKARKSMKDSDASSRASQLSAAQHKVQNAAHAAVGVRHRPCTVVYANYRGFSKQTNVVPTHSAYISSLLALTKPLRAIAEPFTGDRVMMHLNALQTCSAHATKACELMSAVSGEQPQAVRLGAASGKPLCGNLGVDGMKRFSLLGHVPALADVLCRATKRREAAAVADGMCKGDAQDTYYFKAVTRITLPKLKSTPVVVWELKTKKQASEDEWMYQLEEAEGNDPCAKYNSAFAALFHGQQPDFPQEADQDDAWHWLLSVQQDPEFQAEPAKWSESLFLSDLF